MGLYIEGVGSLRQGKNKEVKPDEKCEICSHLMIESYYFFFHSINDLNPTVDLDCICKTCFHLMHDIHSGFRSIKY